MISWCSARQVVYGNAAIHYPRGRTDERQEKVQTEAFLEVASKCDTGRRCPPQRRLQRRCESRCQKGKHGAGQASNTFARPHFTADCWHRREGDDSRKVREGRAS